MNKVHSTSAASADARAAPDDTKDTQDEEVIKEKKLKVEDSKPKSNKFKKNNAKGRRGGAAYTKTPIPTSLQIVPRRRVFPIFTSNIGCHTMSQIVYRVIQGKDFRLASNLSEDQLTYVTTLAFCNRVVQTALHHCTAFPLEASRLKQVASGIQLPSVLAKYIEAIGSLEMSNGVTVVPHCDDYRRLFNNRLMMDPASILWDNGRRVPPGEWAIDVDWVVSYNDATTRASRSGMNFRPVDNTSFTGSNELLVSYRTLPGHMLLPKAPQRMSEAEAQLGAAYRFRDYSQRVEWLGENAELLYDAFTAIPFDPRIVVSDVCVAAFAGNFVSKQ